MQSKVSIPASGDANDGLDSLVALLSPLFEERCYTKGGLLAREGEPADTLFYVEEGEAEICFSIKQRADEDLVDSEACTPRLPILYSQIRALQIFTLFFVLLDFAETTWKNNL